MFNLVHDVKNEKSDYFYQCLVDGRVIVDPVIAKFNPSFYTPSELSAINMFQMHPLPDLQKAKDGEHLKEIEPKHKDYTYFEADQLFKYFINNKQYTEKFNEIQQHVTSGFEVSDSEYATLLVASMINPEWDNIKYLYFETLQYKLSDRIKLLKHQHTITRLSNQFPGIDKAMDFEQAKHYQYLNCLCNRQTYNAVEEFADDLGSRILPVLDKLWISIDKEGNVTGDADKYKREMDKVIYDTFDQVLTRDVLDKIESLDDYWNRRSEFVPSGSASGARYKKFRLNKRAASELGFITLDQIRNSIPGILSTGSTKYEPGKDRVLYSVDIIHHFMEDYVLSVLEAVYGKMPEISTKEDMYEMLCSELTRSKLSQMMRSLLMWDYRDFNLLHSVTTMARLWEITKQIVKNKRNAEEIEDYLWALDWLCEAEKNVRVFTEDNKFNAIITRGMLTGRRGTAFINTNMNYFYFAVGIKNLEEIFQDNNIVYARFHHGDDVHSALQQIKYTFALPYLFNMQGLEGQFTKQTPIGEFLRVSYQPDGSIGGYLNRNLANLVTRDHNRTERKDPINRIGSLIVQLRKIISRGGLVYGCADFCKFIMSVDAQLWRKDEYISIPLQYVIGDVRNGGQGIAWFDLSLSNMNFDLGAMNRVKAIDYVEDIPKIHSMTEDYGNHLRNKFNIDVNDDYLLNLLREDNLQSLVSDEAVKMQRLQQFEILKNSKSFENEIENEINQNVIDEVIQQIYEQLKDVVVEPMLVKNWNKGLITNTRMIIERVGIKRVDVFRYVYEQIYEQEQDVFKTLMKICQNLDVSSKIIDVISKAINILGIKLFLNLIFNKISFNNYMEGYVRDSVLVVLRDQIFNKYIDLLLMGRIGKNIIEFVSRVEKGLLYKLVASNIWRKMKQ